MDDLSTVLRLSDGDCGRAIYSILQHERTGLPADMLIRFLSEDRAPNGRQQRQGQQQVEGGGVLPPPTSRVSGTKSGRSRHSSHDEMMAHTMPSYETSTLTSQLWQQQARVACLPPTNGASRARHIGCDDEEASRYSSDSKTAAMSSSPLFHDVDSRNEGLSTSPLHRGRFPRHTNKHVGSDPPNTVPSVIQTETTESRERSMPQVPCQPLQRSSSEGATQFPSLSSPPEVLLQRLSPDEKDRLLLQLLSSRGQINMQAGQDDKTDLSTRETNLINVQIGILMSLKKEENLKSRDEDNTDDEALEFGIRASKQDFREHCRTQDQENEDEKALIEHAKSVSLHIQDEEKEKEKAIIEHAKSVSLQNSTHMSKEECIIERVKQESLACPNFILGEYCIIEEAKRESLVPKSSVIMEEQLVEEAKQKSLACPPPMSREEHLIEEVRRESLASYTSMGNHCQQALEGSESKSES